MPQATSNTLERSKQWHSIWQGKYDRSRTDAPLHVQDGYDGLSLDEWKKLTGFFLNLVAITADDDILEVGCGGGALLNEIPSYCTLSGVDYSENAVNGASRHLKGHFATAEASHLPFEDESFDVVLSFGVFFYFDSLEYASQAFDEMYRVCRPGGRIAIGEVNDMAKKDISDRLREESKAARASKHVSSASPDHLFFEKRFFRKLAEAKGMDVAFHDEDCSQLSFYYNGPYRFSMSMSK